MELKLSSSSNDVFLYPTTAHEDPASAPDPTTVVSQCVSPSPTAASLIVLNVTLTVPEKHKGGEKIKDLTVVVEAIESLAFPSGFLERNEPFYSKHTIEKVSGVAIQSGGAYSWDLPLLIPCNAAPYERGAHARNFWRASAKVNLQGRLVNKTLKTDKNLFVVQVPTEQSALSYEHTHTGFADGPGPIQLAFISRSASVGGYLRGALLLASPSPVMKLHSISMTLVQTTTLLSRKRPDGYFEVCQPQRFEFVSLKGDVLENAVAHSGALCRPRAAVGDEIELEWIARLPSDDLARPTTLNGSHAAIKVSHQLELSILYDIDKDHPEVDEKGDVLRKRYRITWPFKILSCSLRWRSLVLPEYSTHDSNPVPVMDRNVWNARTEHEAQDHCNCGDALEAVLQYEDEAEASGIHTSNLLREQLADQRPMRYHRGSRSRSRGANSQQLRNARTASRPSHRLLDGTSTEDNPRITSPSLSRRGSHERLGRLSVPSSSRQSSRAQSRSRSMTPRTTRSRSVAPTPDRISIDFERMALEGVDDDDMGGEGASEDSALGEESEGWDDDDDDELMQRLERERIKREQLYQP